MLAFALACTLGTMTSDTAHNAVPFDRVTISDRFWAPRRETNRKVSLPHSLDMLEKAGNMENFRLAAQGKRSGYHGPVFMDSDLYKAIESIGASLGTNPDPALEKRIDDVIALIASAQMEDGYLNTWYQVNEPDKRLTNLAWNHELYCAGHLFEAAVAHFRATGKRTLLNVAEKFADYLCQVFGDGPGQRAGYCGHPEIELALVKLWRVTGNPELFRLAKFFIDHRGERFFAKEQKIPDKEYNGEYYQDHIPIRELDRVMGHAVRAAYLMSGAADVARETNDKGLLDMLDRVWDNTTLRNQYVTGGIGPSASNEGFTVDYDLPNQSAYQETCASVAMAMWAHRMALLTGESRYADVMETALYNGVLAGYSLDGKKYFYVNPLASGGSHHRSEWFGCACCPPNVARTLAELGGYAYATTSDSLSINLFIQGSVDCKVGSQDVQLDVKTNYPWDGLVEVHFGLKKPTEFRLRLRVPAWSPGRSVTVNGASDTLTFSQGYVSTKRLWKNGDVVKFNIDVSPRFVAANPKVKSNIGRLALGAGPLIYCLEQADNSAPIHELSVPASADWKPIKIKGLPGVTGYATMGETTSSAWPGGLYSTAPKVKPVRVVAVPYCFWDNREAGQMAVWIPSAPSPPSTAGLEKSAKVAMSFVNSNCQPEGLSTPGDPASSSEQPASLAHWWNHKGGTEWAEYSWEEAIDVTRCEVYWFDDTGRGECRLPVDWHIEVFVDGAWKWIESTYVVRPDTWCEAKFDKVRTTRLRVVVTMQDGWSAGIHKWRVYGPGS